MPVYWHSETIKNYHIKKTFRYVEGFFNYATFEIFTFVNG